MDKHIFKPSAFFGDMAFEGQSVPDPFESERRSKTTSHENRLTFSETSQKSLKNKENES